MAKEDRTVQVNLRMSAGLKTAAERAAQADQRTLTSLIQKLLTDYCREKGFLRK
jgi:hypothetical protein